MLIIARGSELDAKLWAMQGNQEKGLIMLKRGSYFKLPDLSYLGIINGRILLYGTGKRGKKIVNLLSQLGLSCLFIGAEECKLTSENEFVALDSINSNDVVFLTCDDLKEQKAAEDELIKRKIDHYYYFDQSLYALDCNLQWYQDLVSCYGEKEFENVERMEQEFQKMKRTYESISVYRMWSSRVGEMIYRFEIMMLALPSDEKQYNIIIPYSDNVEGIANKRLMNIFSRYLNIVREDESAFWEYVFLFHASELDGEKADYYDGYKEMGGYLRKRPYVPFIQFSDEEEQGAKEKLKKLQIKNEFVCIHARDSFYLNHQYHDNNRNSYHDYRDFSIQAYRKLADYLYKKGIMVVRMGVGGNEKFNHPNVIDFAMESYDELLDLYLNSQCKYYIGTYTGATVIPKMFAKRLIYINTTSLIYRFDVDVVSGEEIYAPKLMYSKTLRRCLSLIEMMEFELMKIFIPYEKAKEDERVKDIVYIDNTEDEILNVYIEADKRYRGVWEDDDMEIKLQRDYANELDEFKKNHPVIYADIDVEYCLIPHTISSTFLKAHSFLVETK